MNDAAFTLPGLEPLGGRTPAARRAALRAASDDVLASFLAQLADATAESLVGQDVSLARYAGLPRGEVLASPFGARMVALGVEAGATTVHAELRARLPLALDPRTTVEDDGAFVGGVLVEGKYGQTGLEEPFAAYRPAHHAKWGPHELLHRALPFFDRDDASRFELHLGARLQELLPVVTFFGHEEAMRLSGAPFDRHDTTAPFDARLEDARWLDGPRARRALARRAARQLRAGLEHFESELAAARRSLATGTVVHTAHPFLDPASDALAYAAAHAERLEAAPVRRALALAAGELRIGSLAAMLDAVEALHDRLLFGAIRVDPGAHAAGVRRRDALDLGLRLARLGETTLARFEGALATAAATADTSTLRAALGRRHAAVAANGLPVPLGETLDPLVDGLAASCPATASVVGTIELASRLATDPAMYRRENLVVRVRRALGPSARLPAVREALAIDEALRASTADDPTYELSEGRPALTRAFRGRDVRVSASRVFVAIPAAHRPGAEPEVVFVGRVRGEASVVRVPKAVAQVVRGLRAGRPLDGVRRRLVALTSERAAEQLLRTLVDAGVVHLLDRGPTGPTEPDPRRSARRRKAS